MFVYNTKGGGVGCNRKFQYFFNSRSLGYLTQKYLIQTPIKLYLVFIEWGKKNNSTNYLEISNLSISKMAAS